MLRKRMRPFHAIKDLYFLDLTIKHYYKITTFGKRNN